MDEPIGRVGVVGLGNMGLPMAVTLARAGFDVLGLDLDAARQAAAGAQGVAVTGDLGALLRGVDAVVSSLPFGRDVEAVLMVPDGLLARRDRRVVVVDTSTADPGTSRRLATALQQAGHGHLDAPVSGGPAGAASGQLAMMVGGDPSDFARAQPVIRALAARAMHVGPSGAGNVAKLVNNMLVAGHLALMGEALRLAEASGVGAAAVLDVVNAATGRSAISEVHVPRWVMPGGFDSGFSAGLMRKDVRLAAALAAELGADLPLSRAVAALWDAAALDDTADFTRMADFRGQA